MSRFHSGAARHRAPTARGGWTGPLDAEGNEVTELGAPSQHLVIPGCRRRERPVAQAAPEWIDDGYVVDVGVGVHPDEDAGALNHLGHAVLPFCDLDDETTATDSGTGQDSEEASVKLL